MTSTRFWILLFAGVSFCAGLGSGVILAERSHRDSVATSAFGDFERAFAIQFELDPERQRLLAGLLDHYNREAQEIRDRYAAQHHREMEEDLRRVGLEYRAHLRNSLLPEQQRPKFDRLMASYVENL